MKKLFEENEEILDFTTKNFKDIETKAIIAITNTVADISTKENIESIEEEAKKSDDKRYQKVLNKIQEAGDNNENNLRWTTAMVAQKDKVDPKVAEKMLKYSILLMEENQRQDDGTLSEVNVENRKKMISPIILKRLYEKAGVSLEASEVSEQFDEYIKFYDEYGKKLKQIKLEKFKEISQPATAIKQNNGDDKQTSQSTTLPKENNDDDRDER